MKPMSLAELQALPVNKPGMIASNAPPYLIPADLSVPLSADEADEQVIRFVDTDGSTWETVQISPSTYERRQVFL